MAAQDYTVFLKDAVKFSMKGVSSETKEEIVLNIQRIYRDGIPSGLASPMDLMDSHTSNILYTTPPASPTLNAGFYNYVPILLNTDEYNHAAPRDEAVKRTRYVWKNAGGDTLGWAWADRIVHIAIGDVTRV